MKNIIGIALLVIGIVLLGLAYNSYHSAASGVSRVVTGTSTDKTVWLMIGGIVGTVLGLGGLIGAKRTKAFEQVLRGGEDHSAGTSPPARPHCRRTS